MPLIFPFFVGMLLGRAIDLRTYKVSTSVFSDENYRVEDSSFLVSLYTVAEKPEDVFKAGGFPVDVVLHVKAGFINIEGGLNGYNGFFKETILEENTLSILITLSYGTGSRQLAKDLKPLENGINAAHLANSTHYANSVLYGGWFILVHKLKTDHPKDIEIVKKEVISAIGTHGQNISKEFFDSWQALSARLEKLELRGKVHQEYNIYSSMPLGEEYLEPSSLLKNIEKFPADVRKRGDGYGDVTAIWLQPLSNVSSKFDNLTRHSEYEEELFKLNAMLDDLSDTQNHLLSWTSQLPVGLTKEQEAHIGKLLDDVGDVIQVFLSTIPKISFYREIDENLLNNAFDAYQRKLPIKGGSYHLAYRRLKESIAAICADTFHNKVLGQLKLDQDEVIGPIETTLGLEECKEKCVQEKRCRAISFGEKLSSLDRESGMWQVQNNICWIHFRSTGTTPFESSSEWIGDIHTYDRKCA